MQQNACRNFSGLQKFYLRKRIVSCRHPAASEIGLRSCIAVIRLSLHVMMADILKTNGVYSSADVVLFERYTQLRDYAVGRVILKPGDICRSISYVIKGAVYQYQSLNDENENILDLYAPGEWFLNFSSFTSQNPSDSFIKAFSESTILELDLQSLHLLISRSPAFLQLGKIFERSTSRLVFFDNRFTPAQKYQWILDHKQELIRLFPLKMIASYLKITPETLSRVRESFTRG